MDKTILQLFPTPSRALPLKGLYLAEDLRGLAQEWGRSLVYSNYITSLDGRIAIPRPSGSGQAVPKTIANDRDWRLFQELAAQADVLLTSGRYLRDYAQGKAQEILRIYQDPQSIDLRDWREAQGLPPYPDLAVISTSLNFPIPEFLLEEGRCVVVVSTESADADRLMAMEEKVGDVILAGKKHVEGDALLEGLSQRAYKTIYNTSGPKVHHLLLKSDGIDRLYLTFAHRILAGFPFSSIVEGPLLEPPVDFNLRSLHLDPHAHGDLGQVFASYERVTDAPSSRG
jgi:riboflavin biosynthesis pyrimidine reductase